MEWLGKWLGIDFTYVVPSTLHRRRKYFMIGGAQFETTQSSEQFMKTCPPQVFMHMPFTHSAVQCVTDVSSMFYHSTIQSTIQSTTQSTIQSSD